MKEKAMAKINNIGKIGKALSIVLMVFTIIGIAGCLIGGIVTAALPKELFSASITGDADIRIDLSSFNADLTDENIESINTSIKESNVDINGTEFDLEVTENSGSGFAMTGSGRITDFNLRTIAVVCFSAAVVCGALLAVIIFVKKLCKALEICRSPFEENVLRSMKHFAFSLIPWAVVNTIAKGVVDGVLGNSFNIGTDGVPVIAAVLIILALTYIFQYGAVLQQESDETL